VPKGRFTTVAAASTSAPRLMPREVGESLMLDLSLFFELLQI
jgi:hypothetical protein